MACFDLKGCFCLAFKNFSAWLPKNFIALIWGRHLALFIGRKVMAQSRIRRSDFCVWNLPILSLLKIGKILSKPSKLIKNPKSLTTGRGSRVASPKSRSRSRVQSRGLQCRGPGSKVAVSNVAVACPMSLSLVQCRSGGKWFGVRDNWVKTTNMKTI